MPRQLSWLLAAFIWLQTGAFVVTQAAIWMRDNCQPSQHLSIEAGAVVMLIWPFMILPGLTVSDPHPSCSKRA